MITELEERPMVDKYDNCYGTYNPSNYELMNKVNELIEKVNELEHKVNSLYENRGN